MGKNYTPGHASGMFSDWLKPYMQDYHRKQDERDYKSPLGERNVGVLNAILASANTFKKINDTIEINKLATGKYQVKTDDFFDETSLKDLPFSMQPQAIFEKGKTALLGPGVEPIPETMKNGGRVKQYTNGGSIYDTEELNPLEFRKPESIMDQLKPVEIPEIKEISKKEAFKLKGEALDKKLSPVTDVMKSGKKAYGEASSALGSVSTLENKDSSATDKGVAIYNLAEQGERGIRAGVKGVKKIAEKIAKKKAAEELTKATTKEVGKVVAKEGAKSGAKWVGKLAPGVGIATGAHQIATSDNALGKIGGAFDMAAGATAFFPGLGTAASGILGGIGTGLSILGGVTSKPKRGRRA